MASDLLLVIFKLDEVKAPMGFQLFVSGTQACKGSKMNVLIVDDETVMLDSLRIALESSGYRVFQALGAQQAINILCQGGRRIDLVATDYLMPAMNGIELLEAVRRTHPLLPVIIMTAYAETRLVIEAMKNRCDGFIEKPFSLDQLIAEIERIKLNQLRNTRSGDLHQILPRVVHQINNPLLSISGFAELIRMETVNGDRFRCYAEKILDAAEQIGRINKDIINAGRMQEARFNPIALDVLLEGCLEMFHGMFILRGVQVDKIFPEQALEVPDDPFGLEQVFKNLILNAIDAMDGMDNKTLTVSVTPPLVSGFVEVAVKDTGCGIRDELLEKIFEPYFSEKSQGNGLGLVVVKNIVEKHGGKVLVESRMGGGSRFTVRLPATLKPCADK